MVVSQFLLVHTSNLLNLDQKHTIFTSIWESEIYRLRGKIHFEDKNYDSASECFLKSIELCDTSKSNWKALAEASETFIELSLKPSEEEEKDDTNGKHPFSNHSHIDHKTLDWVCTAVYAYMKTINHHLFNSRIYIAKLMDILSRYSKHATKGELKTTFEK
jgi:tetratricopeptide (TPR) repeat protein